MWSLSHWIRLNWCDQWNTRFGSVWLPKLVYKKHCSLSLAPMDRLLWRKPACMPWYTEAALWRCPHGEELRSQSKGQHQLASQLTEQPWRYLLPPVKPSWETLSQNCSTSRFWLVDLLKLWEIINDYYCFKPLNVGVICYTVMLTETLRFLKISKSFLLSRMLTFFKWE